MLEVLSWWRRLRGRVGWRDDALVSLLGSAWPRSCLKKIWFFGVSSSWSLSSRFVKTLESGLESSFDLCVVSGTHQPEAARWSLIRNFSCRGHGRMRPRPAWSASAFLRVILAELCAIIPSQLLKPTNKALQILIAFRWLFTLRLEPGTWWVQETCRQRLR